MSGERVQPVGVTPVNAATNLRRSMIVASVLGLASVVALAFVGHIFMGVFFCVGLSAGAANNRMLQAAMLRYAEGEAISQARFLRRVAVRLGVISIVAVALAIFVRPDGLGVVAGLAVFQVLMLVGAAVPVFRSLRPAS